MPAILELGKALTWTAVNNTLSISLKESWSNDTVEFNNIAKGDGAPPPSDQVGLWPDPEGKKFYRWGGGAPDPEVAEPGDARLWVFTPDADGSGEWSTQEPANGDVFDGIVQGMDGGWTSCNGRGFWVGGYGNERTDARFDNTSNSIYPPIPGYLTYEMESRTWSNDSIGDISPDYGTFMTGEAVCLPKLGEGGLVMMLGGKSAEPDSTADSEYLNLRKIGFIDPIDKTQHYQNIDGDVPDDREHFCAVTARSTTGSYEM
jgi:hypothetical protein